MSLRRAYGARSDDELIAWSAEGDRRAFDEIVGRHGARALRLARRMLGDAALAEDVAQEAMLRAWAQAGRFNPRRAAFTTWLCRIAINLCIDLGRRRAHVPLPEGFDPADPAEGAEAAVANRQRAAAVARALAGLPGRQRAAIILVYDEELSGAEAARVLGVSAKAVERLLGRARSTLRLRLQDEGFHGRGNGC